MTEYEGSKQSNIPYLIAVVVMVLIGVIGILVVTLTRPDKDNSALITIIVGFTGSATPAILALMKSQETHLSVNGRLDQFMRERALRAHSEGILQGASDERARTSTAIPIPVIDAESSAEVMRAAKKLIELHEPIAEIIKATAQKPEEKV